MRRRLADSSEPSLVVLLLLLLSLAAAWWAYAPGLTGTFLFDDYPNLDGLASLNDDLSWHGLVQFVLDGRSSTIGRPLSQLSFALQHASWDRHPADFIRTNILLHLLNALLWFAALLRLQRLGAIPPVRWLPVAAFALWLLLPIHAAAVLYIVQRMTLLAATFTLAGLVLYLSGRDAVRRMRPARGYLLMSAGILLALGPGVLAKETAALTPLLVLALEGTLLAGLPRPRRWRLWSGAFLWLPVAALAAYLCQQLPVFLAGYDFRPFSMSERLLTEARVLLLYLWKTLVPSFAGIRFHYDDLALSTSLAQPWTTAAALAAWAALLAAAIRLRRRVPWFSLGVAWFLAAHLLESTFIPLELAFDHRNYVPTLGPVLATCVGLAWLLDRAAVARLKPVLGALALAYLACMPLALRLSADLWGRPLDQARFWMRVQPDSRRALYHYGDLLLSRKDAVPVHILYRMSRQRWPSDAVTGIYLYRLECVVPRSEVDEDEAVRLLGQYDGNASVRLGDLLLDLADAVARSECPRHPPEAAMRVVDAAIASAWLAPQRVTLQYAGAKLLRAAAQPEQALDRMDQALQADPQVPLLQHAITWSLESGDAARARRYLEVLETSPRIARRTRRAYRDEIRGMRQLIEIYESLGAAPPA